MKKNYTVEFSTAVIAICALAVSIWQGIETRNHNKLSVIPNVAIWVQEGKPFRIDFENTGVGPAIIEEIQIIKYNSKNDSSIIIIDDTNFSKSENQFFNSLDVNLLDRSYVVLNSIGKKFFLKEGVKHNFFYIDSSISESEYDSLKRKLLKYSIKIRYSSLYNELYEKFVDIKEYYRTK